MKISKRISFKKTLRLPCLALLLAAPCFAMAAITSEGEALVTQPPEMPASVRPDSVVPPDLNNAPELFAQADVGRVEVPKVDITKVGGATEIAAANVTQSAEKVAAETGAPAVAPASEPASAGAPVAASAAASKSQSVTVNLINRLVERGILTKQDSVDLIQQAESDAADARIQSERDALAAAQVAVSSVVPPPPSDDAVRVTYIPEVVKAQMRDQIKQEVMEQARDENWAAPRTLPDWVPRFRFAGDVRVRYEGDYYPAGNDNTGGFPNFNAINTGAPFDTTGNNYPPEYNVDQNRTRIRIRARLGAEVDLGDGFTSGIRVATGESNSPTSQNQSLGAANQAQGGNFSKYAIWLDRAFIKYQVGEPDKKFSATVGRFDNPFFGTTMLWANDLGFDGIVAQGKYQVANGVTPFMTAGIFPVFNTDLNFASNQPAKFKSTDKWLDAIQVGTEWKINKDLTATVAAAYYYYQNVEGVLSTPYTPLTNQDAGSTDDTRPSFAQRGNTYMALRDIVPNASNNYGTINQWQYYGLATPFHDLVFTGRLDYNHWEPFQVSLVGEVAKNLAYNHNSINGKAVNNRGTTSGSGSSGAYAGGDMAWIINLKMGHVALENRWDWNVLAGYRYVESDAVVDGFCDSDFGGGGTNLKGFEIGGNLALSPRVWLALRWMSATSIAGPTYKNDILQVDINAKF